MHQNVAGLGNGAEGRAATAAMTAVRAGRFRFDRVGRLDRAAVMAIGRGLLDDVFILAHAAHAGLRGRHGDDQDKYEYQVFHPFVCKWLSTVTAVNDSGSCRISKESARLQRWSKKSRAGTPYGAAIVHGVKVVLVRHNEVKQPHDPMAHAEIVTIRTFYREHGGIDPLSPTDPQARWTAAPGGPAFYAYSTNYLVDTEAGIIVDVEATPARRTLEVRSTRTMIGRLEERLALKTQRLIGDTA